MGVRHVTAGAILLRIVLIFFALQLLAIPFLKAVGAVLLLGALLFGTLSTDWTLATPRGGAPLVRVSLEELGTALFSTWAVPFEVASLVLLVALLGALQIARSSDAPATGQREGAGR